MAAETNAESTANPQDTEAAQKDLPSPPTDATAPEVEPTAEKTTEANTEPSKQSLPAIVTTAEQTPTINDQSPSSPDDVASNASNLDFLETSSSASSFFAGPSRGPSPTPPVSVPYLMAIPGQPVAPAPGVAWQVPVPGPMFVQPYGMVPPPAFATIGPQGNPVYPIVSPMPPQMASSPDTRTLRPASAMVYPAAGPVINGTASRSSPRAMSMMPGGSSSSPPLAAGSPPLQQNPMSVPADSPSLGTSYNAPGGLVGEGTANGTTFATTGTVAAGGSSSSVAASSSNNINGNGNREERLSIDSSFTFNSEATLDGGMITDDTASEVGSVSSAQIAMSSSVVERMELMKVRAKKAKQKQQCFDAARFIIDNVQNVDKSEQKAYCEVAVRALKKLSQQGFPDAQYMLANLYIGGIPGFQERHKPDYAKAFALYASAAKKEHPEALFHVGLCYEQGAGTQQSAARALHNYRKAAVSNHPGAMFRLGMSLLRGELGQSKNPRDGIKWLKLAAKYANEKYPQALYELALLHDRGVHNLVWTDHNYVIELLSRSAELGHAPSQYKLGEAYEYGHFSVQVDPAKSVYYYSLAAAKGHMEAMFELGGWYLTGADDPKTDFRLMQSDSEAFKWVKQAAEGKLPRAMFAMGYFFEMGIGCAKDESAAMSWYEKAAELGDPKAVKKLQERGVKVKQPKKVKPKDKKEVCIVM